MNKAKIITSFLIAIPIVAFALNGSSATPILADVAFATYGQNQVKLCYNGSTIMVNPRDVEWYLNNGATRGKCKPRPEPFTLMQPVVTCQNKLPRVSLDWTTTTYDTFSVQRILGSGPFPGNYNKNRSIQSGIIDTDYVDTRFEPDYGRTNFTYRVAAFLDGQPTYSNEVTFVMPECNPKPTNNHGRDHDDDKDKGGKGGKR